MRTPRRHTLPTAAGLLARSATAKSTTRPTCRRRTPASASRSPASRTSRTELRGECRLRGSGPRPCTACRPPTGSFRDRPGGSLAHGHLACWRDDQALSWRGQIWSSISAHDSDPCLLLPHTGGSPEDSAWGNLAEHSSTVQPKIIRSYKNTYTKIYLLSLVLARRTFLNTGEAHDNLARAEK